MKVYIATVEKTNNWAESEKYVLGVYTSIDKVLERFKLSPKYGRIGWEFDWEEFEVDDTDVD